MCPAWWEWHLAAQAMGEVEDGFSHCVNLLRAYKCKEIREQKSLQRLPMGIDCLLEYGINLFIIIIIIIIMSDV